MRQFNPPNSAFQELWLARWPKPTISTETWNSAKSNGRVRCSLKGVSRPHTSRNTDLNEVLGVKWLAKYFSYCLIIHSPFKNVFVFEMSPYNQICVGYMQI